mmetsp:Transcript_3934/g.8572  ORF Transcript_3934/g.8572 Transcript_3934/m.8572 type:complete len:144 (-) Transcript_3934:586-1017(-)
MPLFRNLFGQCTIVTSREKSNVQFFQKTLLGSGTVNILESEVGWKNSLAIPPTSSVTARHANRATTSFHRCVMATASSGHLASNKNSSPPQDFNKKLELLRASGYLLRSMLLLLSEILQAFSRRIDQGFWVELLSLLRDNSNG